MKEKLGRIVVAIAVVVVLWVAGWGVLWFQSQRAVNIELVNWIRWQQQIQQRAAQQQGLMPQEVPSEDVRPGEGVDGGAAPRR